MKNALKFVAALAVTILLMLAFRAAVFTVYTVRGSALEPCFVSGDRVLVNRWSYGLRTGGSAMFKYTRWFGSPVGRGDLVVFNNPADTLHAIACRNTLAYYCTGLPGDTLKVGGSTFIVPGRQSAIKVTPGNIRLLCFVYDRYEKRLACIRDGKLYVGGKVTRYATFANDYYWFSSGGRDDASDSRRFGLVPETHIIGKVEMLLYSTDGTRPVYNRLRTDRCLLVVVGGGR